MKKFMSTDELARDDRFTHNDVPLDFLMAEEVTLEQVEETMKTMLANDETRQLMEENSAAGQMLQRVRPTDDSAPLRMRSQMPLRVRSFIFCNSSAGMVVTVMVFFISSRLESWDFV